MGLMTSQDLSLSHETSSEVLSNFILYFFFFTLRSEKGLYPTSYIITVANYTTYLKCDIGF